MEGNLKLKKGSKTRMWWNLTNVARLGRGWYAIGDMSISSTLSMLYLLLHKATKVYDESFELNVKLPWTKFVLL
jgi:hypothetical protein